MILYTVLQSASFVFAFGPMCIAIGLTLAQSSWFAFTLLPALGWAGAVWPRLVAAEERLLDGI